MATSLLEQSSPDSSPRIRSADTIACHAVCGLRAKARWRIVVVDDGDYGERHPSSEDIAVIFEVSDTSLRYDRTIKKTMYAAAGFRLDSIVNLRDNVLEVDRPPIPVRANTASRIHSPPVTY